MSEYLSKEEIKQWRSSLEKITLDEYAARLGKVIESEKKTNDLIDIVLRGQPVMSKIDDNIQSKGERLNSIAQKAFSREKELAKTPFTVSRPEITNNQKKAIIAEKIVEKASKPEAIVKPVKEQTLRDEVRLVFNKALTAREQVIFDCFAENKNTVVYAKDLAKLLDLPRDYVYKYIKTLRTKIEGDKLQNSDNGGYVLTM